MQKTEVARTPKSLGQNMLQHQLQKVRAGNCSPRHLPVAIAEAHLAVAASHDILLGDDAPESALFCFVLQRET